VPDVRILVVEDEPLIRLILAEELTEAGFDVCLAASGDEVTALLASGESTFSLLITDIHMPGQHDGVAVARLMRRQDPLLPVLYTSGRPDIFSQIGPPGANDAFLAKPFLPSELVRVARRLLHQNGASDEER